MSKFVFHAEWAFAVVCPDKKRSLTMTETSLWLNSKCGYGLKKKISRKTRRRSRRIIIYLQLKMQSQQQWLIIKSSHKWMLESALRLHENSLYFFYVSWLYLISPVDSGFCWLHSINLMLRCHESSFLLCCIIRAAWKGEHLLMVSGDVGEIKVQSWLRSWRYQMSGLCWKPAEKPLQYLSWKLFMDKV